MVLADLGQIEQVLMNLAVNAQDAMVDGGTLNIQIGLEKNKKKIVDKNINIPPGEYITLTVSDSGCGMDIETQNKIYEPFFTTKGDSGTGLGLATVYGIIKQHQGYIFISSILGEGTTFRIYLPTLEMENIKDKEENNKTENFEGCETVLVVEDNKQVLYLVKAILEEYGYKLILAESGSEALSIMEKSYKQVDLLLTDVVMPEMGGKKLYNRITELYGEISVLFMSGYSDSIIKYYKVEVNGYNFIQKPFSVIDLTTRVRSILNKRRGDS